LKNNLLKNVTFFRLNKKLKLKMHGMNLFWAIMGYTGKNKDITEAIRDAKGGMRRYWNLMEDSMGNHGCPERGLANGTLKLRTVHLSDNTIIYESKVSVQNVFP
jgi:hypothetical protein